LITDTYKNPDEIKQQKTLYYGLYLYHWLVTKVGLKLLALGHYNYPFSEIKVNDEDREVKTTTCVTNKYIYL